MIRLPGIWRPTVIRENIVVANKPFVLHRHTGYLATHMDMFASGGDQSLYTFVMPKDAGVNLGSINVSNVGRLSG